MVMMGRREESMVMMGRGEGDHGDGQWRVNGEVISIRSDHVMLVW